MSSPDAMDDLGPLPISDRQHKLEKLSRRAFEAVLPIDKFIFRNEETSDFGVDGSLELLINSQPTNLRAQVQLKATDKPKINNDGSISLQVDTSNLNYLINGHSPLYVLFVAPTEELHFAWARNEWKRLNSENPNWMKQETFTLRFKSLITTEAIDEIHQYIRDEAQLHKRIHEILGRASITEQIRISIDPNTLSNTDPDEVYKLLMLGGATFIASGFANHVLKLFDYINPAVSRTPRLEMIRSYAYYSLGKYQAARNHAGEALLRCSELSDDDRQFVGYLKDACDFSCGSIDLTEYSKRQENRAGQQTGSFEFAYRLDYIRHQLLEEENQQRHDQLYKEMRSVVDSILAFPDASHLSKLQARLTMLHAEGGEVVKLLSRELSLFKIRQKLGYPADIGHYTADADMRFGKWENDIQTVFKDATEQMHPILMADALNSLVGIRVIRLSTMRAMHRAFDTISEDALYSNMAQMQQAILLHSETGNLEGELDSKLILADLFELVDQVEAAKAIAAGILPKAQAMGYSRIEECAKAHISGNTLLARAKARREEMDNTDEDFLTSDRSYEELRQGARLTLDAMGLPIDRLPVLERGWLAQRDIAQERLNWCQHIQLLEQLGHTKHKATAYRTDPKRHCVCDKYKYESAFGNPDWKIVIQAFKQTYCKGCPSRSPKQTLIN